MSSSQTRERVFARLKAREMTVEEMDRVSGGKGTYTYTRTAGGLDNPADDADTLDPENS